MSTLLSYQINSCNIKFLELDIVSNLFAPESLEFQEGVGDIEGRSEFDPIDSELRIKFNEDLDAQQIAVIDNIIHNHDSSVEPSVYYQNAIIQARKFGQKLMDEFASENILLGIDSDPGMTEVVSLKLEKIQLALLSGSLKYARDLVWNFPLLSRIGPYLSSARLLVFCNKIEDYLNMTLSEELGSGIL